MTEPVLSAAVSPDGKHIVYSSHTGGSNALMWTRADGGGEPRKLFESRDTVFPGSISPDGRRLAYTFLSAGTGSDLWTMPIDTTDPDNPKPGNPQPFLRAPATQADPQFSPDGRWIAYSSNESGHFEVYVRPFPGPGGTWMISAGDGSWPRWSRDGRQIFFTTNDDRVMAVDCHAVGDTFVAGKPRLWSETRMLHTAAWPVFDVSPDGKRLVTTPAPEEDRKGSLHLTFLLNFFDELKRRVP